VKEPAGFLGITVSKGCFCKKCYEFLSNERGILHFPLLDVWQAGWVAGGGGGIGRVAMAIGLDSFRFELEGTGVQRKGDESIK